MKKIILSIAILGATLTVHANNFSMPGFGNNNNGYSNGSSWSMPSFGNNGNGFNNGSSWNMPNMNMGSSNGSGSNFSMPNMNWGNNGSNNGSNWGMPSFGNNGSNWNMPSFGNNNGSNWSMPSFGNNNGSNWGMPSFGNNNNRQYYNNGNVPNYGYKPRFQTPQYSAPRMPAPPRFNSRLNTQKPAPVVTRSAKPVMQKAPMKAPVAVQQAPKQAAMPAKIPMPSQVKGVILAPQNKPQKVEAPKPQ